jgi:hypothetical protein
MSMSGSVQLIRERGQSLQQAFVGKVLSIGIGSLSNS